VILLMGASIRRAVKGTSACNNKASDPRSEVGF
jgi:hypothetical protein